MDPLSAPTGNLNNRLQDVVQLLRQSHHVNPETQQALADLVEELGNQLHVDQVPSEELSHLAEQAAHLAESLVHQKDLTILGRIRDGVDLAASRAEAHAPATVDLARRFLDTLAHIGI